MRRKLSNRYYGLVFAFFMAGCMTCVVSLISTIVNMGLETSIIIVWFSSWAASFVFAFPLTIVVVPIVKSITNKLVSTS